MVKKPSTAASQATEVNASKLDDIVQEPMPKKQKTDSELEKQSKSDHD